MFIVGNFTPPLKLFSLAAIDIRGVNCLPCFIFHKAHLQLYDKYSFCFDSPMQSTLFILKVHVYMCVCVCFVVTPPATSSSIDFSDCHNITEGFMLLVAELSKVLESANFSALKRAFKMRIPGGVLLPDDLKTKIKNAKDLDDLLEALFESKYWNFADLRLIGVLVMSSGIREAKSLVDKYKEVFFSTKLVDILNVCTHTALPPNQYKEYVCRVGSKINKEPDEVTVADLAQYCTALETVIMDINEGSCVLEHVEKGCVEIHWLIPIHCRYHAYKSALNNRHKFHSLHLQYLKIESYPVIYDQFTVQPTVLSTLLGSPNPPVVCKCVCVCVCSCACVYVCM